MQDFAAFYAASITTWDAADHYGPAEVLIGRYLQEHPEQRQNIQVWLGSVLQAKQLAKQAPLTPDINSRAGV